MKPFASIIAAISLAARVTAGSVLPGSGTPSGDYTERLDTLYNSVIVQKSGNIVELRARSRRGEFVETAVDLSDPPRPVSKYLPALYSGLFFQPEPNRILLIGLGGAAFHRLFTLGRPQALLQAVEIDPKIYELSQTRLGFQPTERTPVALVDGRQFIRRTTNHWDWIILDAYRGGFVPPHLKTEEFYRECASHLTDRGVLISNLHRNTALYYSDIKTLQAVFPQVVLFNPTYSGNVIACAVKYGDPVVTDPSHWPSAEELAKPFGGYLDLKAVQRARIEIPALEVARAQRLTDDFSPVEFLNVVQKNNTGEGPDKAAAAAH